MRGQTLLTATVSAVLLGLIPGATGTAQAAITLDLTPVDNSALLTGYTTYDLQVTADTDWTAAAGLLELTAGSIYQHAQGSDRGVPSPRLMAGYPAMVFDTYVVGNVAGGAGDVGGTGYAFTDSRLDVSWFNIDVTDIGTTTIGRLTVTDDAAGQLSLLLTSKDDLAEYDVTISPGVLPVLSEVMREVRKTPVVEDGLKLNVLGERPTRDERYAANPYLLDWSDYFAAPTIDTGSWPTYRTPLWNYGDAIPERSSYFEMADRHQARLNTFYFLDPGSTELSDDYLPSLLPEPGALVLVGVGLGAAVLRRR